jgi:stage II sporulation protein M
VLQNLKQAFAEHIREQFGMYLFVLLIFTVGVVAGALSVRLMGEAQASELNEYFYLFVDYLTERQPVNQTLILQRSIIQNSKFMLALWLGGAVFFGFIFSLGAVFYRGFTIGFTVGFLAEQNAVQGVLFSLGAVLPQNLIYVPVTVIAGVLSASFSLLLFRRRFSKKTIPFGSYFIQFTIAMLVALLVFTAGSVVEAMITPVFMRAVASLL